MSGKRLLTVTDGDPDTLAAFLAQRLGWSLQAAERAIVQGSVFVKERRARTISDPLTPGQRLRIFEQPDRAAPPTPHILFQDDSVVCVDKPPLLPSQPSRRGGPSVLSLLSPGPLFLPHRLDADTSGVLLLARSAEVAGVLSHLFANRRFSRTYAARVMGSAPVSGNIDLRLSKPRATPSPGRATGLRQTVLPAQPTQPEAGRFALTRFEKQAQRHTDHGPESLLRLFLATGRTHQIRAHLAAIGHPICGDTLYGGPPDARIWLHAVELSFVHPKTGKPVRVTAPLPEGLWPTPASEGKTASL
ncbi:MAG TPA: RluA family pseudouridine synthase [Pseudomonadota bacterium]|nr:RluA family pseudouridine synthase [Pseudomonadota bacterium]